MNLKKRTKTEVDDSILSGDYTGGYEMLPWFIYKRQLPSIGIIGSLVGGIASTVVAEGYDRLIGVFFILASMLIYKIFSNDYKKLKKGQSS